MRCAPYGWTAVWQEWAQRWVIYQRDCPLDATTEDLRPQTFPTKALAKAWSRHSWRKTMRSHKVLYTGLFLCEPHKLLDWWVRVAESPVYSVVYGHHLTLKFKPTPEEVEALPIGEEFLIAIDGWVEDDFGQAVSVGDTAGLPCSNEHPHITVACAWGTPPVYSNQLLENKKVHPAAGFFKVRAGYVDGRGNEVFE